MNIKNRLLGISADNKRRIIVIIGIVGIILISISELFQTDSLKTDEKIPDDSEEFTIDSYRKGLETELEQIVSKIDGAGEVNILITMDSTAEDVYILQKNIDERAKSSGGSDYPDSESEYKEENEYVIIKSKDGNEQAVLQKQVMPRIRGVLVVCSGGGNSLTREKITKAVSSVLNISTGKVYVTS